MFELAGDLYQQAKARKCYKTDDWAETKIKYDAVFLISVLHTIPYPKQRKSIVELCRDKLKKNGYLVFDTPQSEGYYRNAVGKSDFNDGWAIRRGGTHTFYKNYYAKELNELFESVGLTKYEVIRRSHHLIRIYQI